MFNNKPIGIANPKTTSIMHWDNPKNRGFKQLSREEKLPKMILMNPSILKG
jgi:hypothetical protein